jgi:hypothetical protein
MSSPAGADEKEARKKEEINFQHKCCTPNKRAGLKPALADKVCETSVTDSANFKSDTHNLLESDWAGKEPAPAIAEDPHGLLKRAGLKPAPTRLSELVRAIKTFSARRINALRKTSGVALWQRNYYEHVVRNVYDLNRIREYIVTNPANWQDDELYNPE